jgi:hypothetical protein
MTGASQPLPALMRRHSGGGDAEAGHGGVVEGEHPSRYHEARGARSPLRLRKQILRM